MNSLQQLQREFKRAYNKAKLMGKIPATDRPQYDFAIGQAYSFHGREGKLFWRRFQRRASGMYCESIGQPYTMDLDWETIWLFLLDNILPLLQALIRLLPIFIGSRDVR